LKNHAHFFKHQHIVTSVRNFSEGSITMDKNITLTSLNDRNGGGNGYKIIEVNVKDPAEHVFAVVTPVKIK
jgi:hypothetical protein